MKKNIAILLLAAVAIILIGISDPAQPKGIVDNKTVETFTNLLFEYNTIRYPAVGEVVQTGGLNQNVTVGFATEDWRLNFGAVPANGSYSTRTVSMQNTKDANVLVMLRSHGNISDLVSFDKNDFVLEPNESAIVSIVMKSQNDIGNYTGEIDITTKKPIYNYNY